MRFRIAVLPMLTALAATGLSGWEVLSAVAQAPSFQAQTIDDRVSIGYGLEIADVDGDRRPDILMADKTQIVWYRNGEWQRRVIAENLTSRDNVAIAARDIDGDGKVEIAVGAQWNPNETSDTELSGAIRYLIRPQDSTQMWEALSLPHEPTTHRMRWVRTANGRYSLVVLPLHGRGNRNSQGAGVKVVAYVAPANPRDPWPPVVLDSSMNATHNFDVVEVQGSMAEAFLVGGKQGLVRIAPRDGAWVANSAERIPGVGTARGIGEIRQGRLGSGNFFATIEPMHGNEVVVYLPSGERKVVDPALAEGHGLATGDLLGIGRDQVVAGWRLPDASGKVGIRLYVPDATGANWTRYVIDDNTMATEDLKVADLDGDGRMEIIAAGRASKNVIVYWNKSR